MAALSPTTKQRTMLKDVFDTICEYLDEFGAFPANLNEYGIEEDLKTLQLLKDEGFILEMGADEEMFNVLWDVMKVYDWAVF